MAATTALREALTQGISSGNLADTKIILYSHRDSSGRVCRPKALYATSHVLKTVPYFNDLLFGDFAESQSRDFSKDTIDEAEYAEDYGYLSDSDLEDDGDGEAASAPTPGEDKKDLCEAHEERVEKGKIVKLPDMAFVTFKAFLMYLYTNTIEFAPFGSKENRRSRSTEIATLSDDKVPRPSPKSIYRLADKYDIPALKAMALDHIRGGLTQCDIVEEAFSKFASRYDEMGSLYVNQLASVWMDDSTTETTRVSFDKKVDGFAKGGLEHATQMLTVLLEIGNKDDDIVAPSDALAATEQVVSPAHWASVKLALIRSVSKGVFFDRKYWARHSNAGDVLRPIYFSSTIMDDKVQELKGLVAYLKDRNALTNYLEGDAGADSDCEGDPVGADDGALKTTEEKEEQARAVFTAGSFSAWRSLFFYRCTDMISFAPLESQGADSRSNYIRGIKTTAAPPPCSPKSIYVLASLLKLGIQPLRDDAFADVKSKVSPDNVMSEVFSWFTAGQAKIMDMQCDLLIPNLKNPKMATLMKQNIEHISNGSSPHRSGALKLVFKKTFELKKQGRSVLLRCSNPNCEWHKNPALHLPVGPSTYCVHCSYEDDYYGPGCYYSMQCAGCGYARAGSHPRCGGCGKRFR